MKEKYEKLIELGYSTHRMARELGIGQCTIRYWLKKFGLKTNPRLTCYPITNKTVTDKSIRICSQCKEQKAVNTENFYINKKGKVHGWCRSCNDRITLDKQRKLKLKSLEYKGGKCVICGYTKCLSALDFHHVDPTKKEFTISQLRTYSWEKIQKELDKCVCLCKNCHAEVHSGSVVVPGFEPGTSPL